MANTISLNDIWQATFRCQAQDQAGLNVLAYQCSVQVALGCTDVELAGYLGALMGPLYAAILPTTTTFQSTKVFRLLPALPFLPYTTLIGGASGAVPGDAMARQVSGIITKRTPYAGQGYRGRVYLPFPSESSNTVSGTPEVAYLNSANLLAQGLFTPFTVVGAGGSGTFIPVLAHKIAGVYTPITAYAVQPKWATQRRRGSYGRPNP